MMYYTGFGDPNFEPGHRNEEKTMKRTNISLEEWQHEYLKERARREEKSMSALIREIVEQYAKKERQAGEDDAIHDIVGMASSSGGEVAREHDQYLYEGERNKTEDPEND